MGWTERHTSLGVMGLAGPKHPKFWDLTISRPTVWNTQSPVPTKFPFPLMVTSPQVLTASRLAAAQLPTDLLRTQAIRHGAQLWGWRFEVCHTNLQEPHILLFRVTWKDKWRSSGGDGTPCSGSRR